MSNGTIWGWGWWGGGGDKDGDSDGDREDVDKINSCKWSCDADTLSNKPSQYAYNIYIYIYM